MKQSPYLFNIFAFLCSNCFTDEFYYFIPLRTVKNTTLVQIGQFICFLIADNTILDIDDKNEIKGMFEPTYTPRK